MALTIKSPLGPRLKKCRAIPLLPPMSSWHVLGWTSHSVSCLVMLIGVTGCLNCVKGIECFYFVVIHANCRYSVCEIQIYRSFHHSYSCKKLFSLLVLIRGVKAGQIRYVFMMRVYCIPVDMFSHSRSANLILHPMITLLILQQRDTKQILLAGRKYQCQG